MHCEKCVTYTSSLTQDSRENTLCKPSKWIELCYSPTPAKKTSQLALSKSQTPLLPYRKTYPDLLNNFIFKSRFTTYVMHP